MTKISKPMSAGDWRARSWDDFAGQYVIKDYWKDFIPAVKFDGACRGFNALIVGESRSGKTATTEFGVQCLGCLNLNRDTLDPCGQCESCRDKYHKYGHGDWRHFINYVDEEEVRTPIHLHHVFLDCPRLTPSKFDSFLDELKDGEGFIQVVSLDEMHTLEKHDLDDKLLASMDKFPATWIGMSACISNQASGRKMFEQMVINRCQYRMPTEKPSEEDFQVRVLKWCEEFGVAVDEFSTIEFLMTETNRVMGDALAAITVAQNSRDKVLTKELIRKQRFLR